MGNSAFISIGNRTSTCLKLQTAAAEKLQSLSEIIRQKDANVVKAAFASDGAVSVGKHMTVMGAAASFLKLGMVAVPLGIGAATGIAGGAGEVEVSCLESEEMTKRIAEVQNILEQLREETQGLIAALRRKRKYTGVPDYDILMQNKTKLDCAKKCGRRARKAISVVNRMLQVQWMASGPEKEELGVQNIDIFGRGLIYQPKVKAGKVTKSAGVAAPGVTLAFDIKDVLKNLMDVKNNVSEVADVVADMANVFRRY